MNLQGTLIGEKQRLENILASLISTFNSKKNTELQDLKSLYTLISKINNSLLAINKRLEKEGFNLAEDKLKVSTSIEQASSRIKELEIKSS